MADFAMWGPEKSGFRLAEQDSIANFVKLSQGQHNQALAAQEQEKALQMRREREAISKLTTPDGTGGPGAGGSISDILRDQSRQLIRLGQPVKAGQLAVQASQVDQHEQAALTSQVGAQVKQLEGQIKMDDAVSQLDGGARNQRDWDVATLMFSQQFPKQENPPRHPLLPTTLAWRGIWLSQRSDSTPRSKVLVPPTLPGRPTLPRTGTSGQRSS